MGRPKRHKGGEEHHENHERWLITYADMITLLMAFFIMMYCMSVVDLKKFADLATAMGHVFGGGASGAAASGMATADSGVITGAQSLVPSANGWSGPEGAALVRALQQQVQRTLPAELRDTVELTRSAERITVSMQASSVTFPAGTAMLSAQARTILTQLGAVLRQVNAPLVIEGHTCDLPISSMQFPSNWELSAARANAVMLFLVRHCGIAPERISTAAYGATRPRVPNTSEANRRRNRRVDIVILPSNQTCFPPASGADLQAAPGARSTQSSALPEPVQILPPMALAAEYHARQAAAPSEDESGSISNHQEE